MSISTFLQNALSQVQAWLSIISVFFFLYAGFVIWTSGDNPQQRSRGWRQLATSASGLIVILFARELVAIVFGWAGMTLPFPAK